MKKIILYITPFLLLVAVGCKKDYLETKPSNAVTQQEIFGKLSSVYAALDGVVKEQFAYGVGFDTRVVTRHDNFGQKSFDLAADLMGNDMILHTQGYGWFNSNYNLTEWTSATQNRQSDLCWYFYYDILKQVNTILTNIDGVADATDAQKDAIKGESLALRAYAYFNLVNFFQQTYKGNESKPGVPIYNAAVSVDPKGRGTVKDNYNLIVADLTLAETLLTGKARTSKANIDVTTVQGLRARVALLMEDWPTAASYAVKARTGYTLMTTSQYTAFAAFSSVTNAECIWGSIIPANQSTIYASLYSHMDIRTGGYAALGGQKKIPKALYDQIPAADIRKSVFKAPGTGTSTNPDFNQLKLQVPVAGSWAADYLYMRAGEMYLAQAEALSRQAKDAEARTALETMVKARNPAYSAAAFSGAGLLAEILLQRRIELWGEGFSLMDIKRLNQGLNRPTGLGNHGAPNFDPGIYTTPPADPRFLMRIPQRELDNNPNMTIADQNP